MGSSPVARQAPVQFVADPVDGAYLAQMGAEEVPQSTAAAYQQQPTVTYEQPKPVQPAAVSYSQARYASEAEPSREQECTREGDQVSELRAKLA